MKENIFSDHRSGFRPNPNHSVGTALHKSGMYWGSLGLMIDENLL